MYGSFIGLVLVLLALDLGVFNRKAKEMSIASAVRWTALWISLALIFNGLLYIWTYHELHKPEFAAILSQNQAAIADTTGGLDKPPLIHYGVTPDEAAKTLAFEFLVGYVVEISLSVDNLFVFLVLFSYFKVPANLRHRVLFYGILGALACRALFIALGSYLFQFWWVVIVFGLFLIATGLKLLFAKGNDGPDPDKNPVIRLLHRFLPVTDGYRGSRFIIREAGRRMATPLFVTLVAVELTDIVFAVDSIPAIYGITKEPLIVFTSNVFAILGLRSMFFVLAGAMDRFHLLRYGLGFVLAFVGCKMTFLGRFFEDGHFPIEWSLGIIVLALGLTLTASLMFPKRKEHLPSDHHAA
ncbi:MAG: TerC/Alx family metal homeostasis membrane protein [Phycisphaerae bacterium]|nr:TerC/Alx family metal homeostasis membrane protein [Phycisphaerae bacterium]